MNTNTQLVELVKVKMLDENQHVNWNFLPQGYISFGNIRNLMFSFVEALFFDGQKDLSEKVLKDVLHYYVVESGGYYRYSSATSGSWVEYKRRYGSSPCCCCDQQSEVSSLAATLGFENLKNYAVSIQCPTSPIGYRREPSKGWSSLESYFDKYRSEFVYSHLQDFLDGKVDLLER